LLKGGPGILREAITIESDQKADHPNATTAAETNPDDRIAPIWMTRV
jgi:hypothetical protein